MSVKKFTKGVYVCRVRNTQNYRIIFHIYADMQSELKTLSFFVANRYIVPKIKLLRFYFIFSFSGNTFELVNKRSVHRLSGAIVT